MNRFESAVQKRDLEAIPGNNDQSAELRDVDLRRENELFQDHERIDNNKDTSDNDDLAKLRDQLSEDSDGIIHIDIPAYKYNIEKNPFVGMDSRRVKTYEISRYIDVVFLHRFMYQDIIVCGLQSRAFVDDEKRANFVKHIRETGGISVDDEERTYDILGREFRPYMPFHTTDAFFRLYHTTPPLSEVTPHFPLDVWLIFDANAYTECDGSVDFRQAFLLKSGFSRRASLLGIAQIN